MHATDENLQATNTDSKDIESEQNKDLPAPFQVLSAENSFGVCDVNGVCE